MNELTLKTASADHALDRRDRITAWLLKRDTVMMEAALGLNGLLNIGLILSQDRNGNPVAPFLSSALSWFSWANGAWLWALILYTSATLAALVHGQMTGNSYRIRSMIQLFGAGFQTFVAVGVFTSPDFVFAVGARYFVVAFWAWISALVLIVKHDSRKAKRMHNVAPND